MEVANQLRDITLEEARESYAELKEIACGRTKPFSRAGIKALDYFFLHHRIAAMALDIPYVGIDANRLMEPTYKKMIKEYDPTAKVQLFFQPSETVDFKKFSYDLIFTSPPYFMLEEYEKMPQYGSKEGFLEKFFRPVVEGAWAGLAPGGHMALNMPHDMYMAVRGLLPKIHSRIVLPVSNRHPTNAGAGRAIGVEKERHEYTYVWKKGGGRGGTRRRRRERALRGRALRGRAATRKG